MRVIGAGGLGQNDLGLRVADVSNSERGDVTAKA
jgi:hypothetical protein